MKRVLKGVTIINKSNTDMNISNPLTHVKDIPEDGIGGCGYGSGRGGRRIVRGIDMAQFLIHVVMLHVRRRRTIQIDKVAVDSFSQEDKQNAIREQSSPESGTNSPEYLDDLALHFSTPLRFLIHH